MNDKPSADKPTHHPVSLIAAWFLNTITTRPDDNDQPTVESDRR